MGIILFALDMKTIHRTYRFAIMTNKVQETLLYKPMGSVRFVYNHFLHARQEHTLRGQGQTSERKHRSMKSEAHLS